MAVTEQTVSLTPETVARVQAELRALGVEGWLLFNFNGNNPLTTKSLLSREGISFFLDAKKLQVSRVF